MNREIMSNQPEPIKPEEPTQMQPKEEPITKMISVQENNAPIVMPVVSSKEALTAWNAYLDLKKQIIEENDVQIIQGKQFLKKSYWRKIATFFNLTVDLENESHEELNGELVWNFACKATAPNGRSAIGTGSCSAFEKATYINGKPMQKGKVTEWGKTSAGKSYPVAWEWEPAQPNSIHNVRTTAETRAWNRAVSNLVGGGEVSAEEVDQQQVDRTSEFEARRPAQTKPRPTESGNTQTYSTATATEPQRRMIFAIKNQLGITDEEFKAKYKIESTKDLTKQQASDIITELKKMNGEE
jgi:hypothetical protein